MEIYKGVIPPGEYTTEVSCGERDGVNGSINNTPHDDNPETGLKILHHLNRGEIDYAF